MTDAVDERVSRRFDVIQKLGQGAYGIVWKAVDKRNGTVVALKKCFDAFRCNTDAQRTFREVMYLQALAGHDDIIAIQRVIRAENDRDLYITFDYMETDLLQVIRANILEGIHMKYIIYQLLKALKYIHSARLLHRDIKPSNILIDSSCKIKLCDFGLCRSIADDDVTDASGLVLTDYVATRWYRSPEILMGSTNYTEGLDLWSVACILGEMFRGRPLIPGSSSMHQVEKIFELTGNPTASDVNSWKSNVAPAMLENVKARSRVKLSELCPNIPKDAKHFMKGLFKLNPNQRGSAGTALGQVYLSEFHNPETEPSYAHGPIKIGIDDNTKLSADDYRQQLYTNISEKRNEARQFRIEITHNSGQSESRNAKSGKVSSGHRRDETKETVTTDFSCEKDEVLNGISSHEYHESGSTPD